MAGFVVMAITLPIYRAIELTQSANQLAGYAQNYYSQHGHYPDTVPIPLIWNTGEMSAISYSAGDQEASVDESLFFFTRHDILLDHGKVSISDLD